MTRYENIAKCQVDFLLEKNGEFVPWPWFEDTDEI